MNDARDDVREYTGLSIPLSAFAVPVIYQSSLRRARGDHLDTATRAMAVGHWCAQSARRIFSELRKLDASLPDGFTLVPAKALDLSFWVGSFPGTCVA